MPALSDVRQSMMKWQLFLTACIFVAGLMLKVGAPLPAVALGVGFAALANGFARRRDHHRSRSTSQAVTAIRGTVHHGA